MKYHTESEKSLEIILFPFYVIDAILFLSKIPLHINEYRLLRIVKFLFKVNAFKEHGSLKF